jgi:threonine/homoserine/homoserine lactone efflux protein
MQRIAQIRVTDWAVRIIVALTFFAFFISPDKWAYPLVLICFIAVGLWGLLYPEGLLGWAKVAHRRIDVDDRSIWWMVRLIGAFFVFFGLVLALAYRGI